MLALFRHRVAATFLALVIGYVLAALVVPTKFLIELGDAFAVPMSCAAAYVYAREVYHRDRTIPLTDLDWIMVAISGGWGVNALDRLLRLWARLFDASILDSEVLGLFLFLLCFFASMHVDIMRGSPMRAGLAGKGGRFIVKLALAAGFVLAAATTYVEWFYDP